MKDMKKALEKVSMAVKQLAKTTSHPAGVYFDADGKLWYVNKHYSFDELAKKLTQQKET